MLGVSSSVEKGTTPAALSLATAEAEAVRAKPSVPRKDDGLCRLGASDSKRASGQDARGIRLYPALGLHCYKAGHSTAGAWRVWTVAKKLDPEGSGVIRKAALTAYLDRMGIPASSQRSYIAKAKSLGIFMPHEHRFFLASPAKLAVQVECTDPGFPAELRDERMLWTANWRHHVWGAFNSTIDEAPVSRATKERLTSIPRRTQIRWDKAIDAERRRNIAETDNRDVEAAAEHYDKPHAFRNDYGVAAWRMPDTVKGPDWAYRPSRGRRKHIRREIKTSSLLLERGNQDQPRRMYFESSDEAMQAKSGPELVYYPNRVYDHSTAWRVACL